MSEAIDFARVWYVGALEVDLDGYRASFAGRALSLSSTQFEVLGILVANLGKVTSRAELVGLTGVQHSRSIDVAISTLRKQIGRDFIRNVRKRGWVVVPEALEA
jgi:DNA-binding response OmpR family regulator